MFDRIQNKNEYMIKYKQKQNRKNKKEKKGEGKCLNIF